MSLPGGNKSPYRAPCDGTALCGNGPRYQHAKASEKNIAVWLYNAVVPDWATVDNYIAPYERPVAFNECSGEDCAGADICSDPTSSFPPCLPWIETPESTETACQYNYLSGASNPPPVSWYQPQMLASVSVASGGSGYHVGDLPALSGGTTSTFVSLTGASNIASVAVAAVNGSGAVTAVTINDPGSYQTNPSSPDGVTGGHGTGLTLNLTFNNQTMDF